MGVNVFQNRFKILPLYRYTLNSGMRLLKLAYISGETVENFLLMVVNYDSNFILVIL